MAYPKFARKARCKENPYETQFMIIACAVLGYLIVSTAGFAAGRDDESRSKPFQVALDLVFENTTPRVENEFTVENSTASLSYIVCEMSTAGGSASNQAAFKLFVRTESSDSLLVLDSLMERGHDFASGPSAGVLIGNAFVSACIGKKCESLNGLTYESFVVSATRDAYNRTESMHCILVGELHD